MGDAQSLWHLLHLLQVRTRSQNPAKVRTLFLCIGCGADVFGHDEGHVYYRHCHHYRTSNFDEIGLVCGSSQTN